MTVFPNASKSTIAPDVFFKLLASGVLVITLLVFVLAGLSLRRSRIHHEQVAFVTAQNFAQVIGQSIGDLIDKIDVVLLTVKDEAEKDLATGHIEKQKMDIFIANQLARIPELQDIRISNKQGEIVYGIFEKDGRGRGISIIDRDYFLRLQGDPKSGLVIPKPLVGRIRGKWALVFARRINLPDGSFAGILWGAISLETFSKLLASVDIGPHGGISLRDREMGIIARHPAPKDIGSIIGNKTLSPELRKLFEAGQTSGTFFTPASWDNIAKVVSYRKIANYPLYVNVGIATEDYLAEWRDEIAKMFILVALFFLVVLCLAWLLYRYITERKQAEEELRQRTEELEMLMETTPATIWIARDPLCREIRGNKTAYELLRLPPGTNVSKSAPEGQKPLNFEACNENGVIPSDDLPMQRSARTGEAVKGAEFEFRFTDGRSVWIYGNAVPLRDAKGAVRGSVGAFVDITERKKAEEILRENESRFRTAIESIPFDFWMMGKDGRYIMLNSTCIKNWGYIIGKRPEEINMDADVLSLLQENNRKAFAGETVYGDVMFIVGGEERFFHNIISPIYDDKTIQGILGINIDITERKKMEEALRKWNEALELRVFERTSELKTAHDRLRNLALHLQTIREEERTKMARDIHDELGQVLTAMKMDLSWFRDNYRDHKSLFNRTDAMLDRLNSTILSVRSICTELRPSILDDFGLVAAMEWQAHEFEKRTGIGCIFSSQPNDIELDKERSTILFRIFQEALTNVMKHAKATKVMSSLKKDDERIVLEVIDNGKGIIEEELSKAQSFGLIGMRERVFPWGGEVEILGTEGVGTTVKAFLPLSPSEQSKN